MWVQNKFRDYQPAIDTSVAVKILQFIKQTTHKQLEEKTKRKQSTSVWV